MSSKGMVENPDSASNFLGRKRPIDAETLTAQSLEQNTSRSKTVAKSSANPQANTVLDTNLASERLAVLQSAASLLAVGMPSRSSLAEPFPPTFSYPFNDTLGRSPNDAGGVGEPRQVDILCGRGRGYFCHPGNRRMLEIVEQNKPRYRSANKTRKSEIVRELTSQIQEGGVRFLKRGSGKKSSWFEVTATEKHKKVCHCLREEKGSGESSTADDSSRVDKQTTNAVDNRQESGSGIFADAREVKRRKTSSSPCKDDLSSESSTSSSHHTTRNDSSRAKADNATDAIPSVVASAPGGNILDLLGKAATIQMKNEASTPGSRSHGNSDLEGLAGRMVHLPQLNAGAAASLRGMVTSHYAPFGGLSLPSHLAMRHFGGFHSGLNEQFGIYFGDPRPCDVLFGQDVAFHAHEGNLKFRALIRGHITQSPRNKEQKILLARRISADIKQTGGCFLTRQLTGRPGIWYKIEEHEAETLIVRCIEEEETRIQAIVAVSGARSAGNFLYQTAPYLTENSRRSSVSTTRSQPLRTSQTPYSSSGDRAAGTLSSAEEDTTETEDESDDDLHGGSAPIGPGPDLPGPNDVICGRGRGNFRHLGNRRMLRMFWDMKAKYNAGSKAQKTLIGRDIVRAIRSQGGRFLKRSENGWEEVGEKVALRKVCHGIRDIPSDPEKRKRSIVANDLEDEVPVSTTKPSPKPTLTEEVSTSNKIHPTIDETARVQSLLHTSEIDPSLTGVGKASNHISNSMDSAQPLISFAQKFGNRSSVNHSVPSRIMALTAEAGKIVDKPTDMDVLCGRGRGNFGHSGNRRMLDIISRNTARYKKGTKSEKGKVARDILSEVMSIGARFLKRVEGENGSGKWQVCNHHDALQKVCHGIRDTISNIEGKHTLISQGQKEKPTIEKEGPLGDSPRPGQDMSRDYKVSDTDGDNSKSHISRQSFCGTMESQYVAKGEDYSLGGPKREVLGREVGREGETTVDTKTDATEPHASRPQHLMLAGQQRPFPQFSPEEQAALLDRAARMTPAELLLWRERELRLRYL